MSQESCFEKLEQLVFDENRIVTYKIVSNEMKIHVNKAKEYLNDFYLTRKTNQNPDLNAYYFLAGQIERDGFKSVKILITPEEKLEKSKAEFYKLTSCHIYSVSSVRLKDECALYTTDIPYNRDSEELQKYAAVRHQCVRHQMPKFKDTLTTDANINGSKNQNQNVKENNGIVNVSKQKVESRIKSVDVESPSKDKTELESRASNNDSKRSSIPKKNSKPNTLVSLWQQKEETKSVDKKISKADEKVKKGSVKSVEKNNILNMFSKQAEKNALSGVKNSFASAFNAEIKTPKEVEVASCASKSSLSTVTVSQKRKSLSKRVSSKKLRNKNDSESEEEIQPKKKKHKRICTFEDSDSESENEEIQDKAQRNVLSSPAEIFTQVASDDSEDPIPPTPPAHSIKGKGKVWKTVQKTFQDEDGFFVTKKEKELVSVSEDSDEDPIKSKTKETILKKTSPNKGISAAKKQASLTNYFKQK